MPERLMIDSGAFSVWNAGRTIDLDEYIRYLVKRPNFAVIVNLDVIPPRGIRLTNEVKEETCKQGWKNYLKMIRVLPMEKVIPVFHRGESIKWLETYLDFGCPYIGLAPRVDNSGMTKRLAFLSDMKKVLYDSKGEPIVKTHGFAVTNHRMMCDFKWYSVDSSTYTQMAAWGIILVPKMIDGKWDFAKKPYRVFCSVIASMRQDAEYHILAMREQRPEIYRIAKRWLDENNIGLGEHEIVPANGAKLKKVVEKWADRAKTKILKVKIPGVCNSDQVRRWINAVYYHHCNDVLGITHLYLAGNGPCVQVEEQIRYRLRSFAEGQKTTDWIYPLIGWYHQPFEFPVDEDLDFSFSKGLSDATKARAATHKTATNLTRSCD